MKAARNGSYLGDVLTLSSGTAFSQVLVILSTPLLTRVFTPEDFGALGVYGAFLAFGMIVATGKLELAVPLPRLHRQADGVILTAASAAAAAAVCAGLGALMLKETTILQNLGVSSLLWWALPIGIILGSGYKLGHYWAIRQSLIPSLALAKAKQSVAMVGLQLGLGISGLGGAGLIVGHISGHSAGSWSLLSKWHRGKTGRRTGGWREMRWAASRFRRFPLVMMPAALINAAGRHAPVLLLGVWFPGPIVGYYVIANRVMKAPVRLLGKAIADVTLNRVAGETSQHRLMSRVYWVSNLLAWPLFGIVAALAPALAEPVLGEGYSSAGVALAALAPAGAALLTITPISALAIANEQHGIEFWAQVSLLVSRIGGLSVGAALQDWLLAVALFSLGSTIVWWIYGARLTEAAGGGIVRFAATTIFGCSLGVATWFSCLLILSVVL